MLEPLVPRDRVQAAEDWLPDGRTLVMSQVEPFTASDLLLVDVETRQVSPFATAAGSEGGAAVSPDGRWIAFVWGQDEGNFGIYVSPLPAGGDRRVLVAASGSEPRWSRDGRELFFRTESAMHAVAIEVVAGAIEASAPVTLFRGEFERRPALRANYDVTRDGRFVMLRRKEPLPAEIVLDFNWREADKRH